MSPDSGFLSNASWGECHLLLVAALLYEQISFLGLLCLLNCLYPQDLITDVALGKVLASARTVGLKPLAVSVTLLMAAASAGLPKRLSLSMHKCGFEITFCWWN